MVHTPRGSVPASTFRGMGARTGGVRHALRVDLANLEVTLGDAFTDDPMMRWLYPDPETRTRHATEFMRVALEIGFPHGHVYATGADAGAAIWAPPDVDLFDDAAIGRLFELFGEQVGPRVDEVATGLTSVSEQHPHDEPHFYLFVLGTQRVDQGKGVGSALMRDMLDRCDQQGLGAYLESSNIRNVPFYERHGFRVMSEVKVSDEFVARPMWRDPRPVGGTPAR